MKLCPQKCLIFADIYEPAQVPIGTIGLLETHMNKKIVPSPRSHCLQVTEERLNSESTAEPFYAKTDFPEVRQGCHLFAIVD